MGDGVAASELAESWKNDRYLLFPDGEESSAVLWDIELESQVATDKLQSAALKLIAKMAGRQESGSLGMTMETSDKRHLLITRPSAVRVRFLNTFEASTAALLGSKQD